MVPHLSELNLDSDFNFTLLNMRRFRLEIEEAVSYMRDVTVVDSLHI